MTTTEQKILEAARQVFLKKGMDGARMQEIANETGINKALLHYYYRSKDKLFEAVFNEIFTQFITKISLVLLSDAPVKEKMSLFVDSFIDKIAANPFVPQFIIGEINRDPAIIKKMMQKSGFNPDMFVSLFGTQFKNLHFDVRHFIVSLLGLCIFPFAARPLIENVYFNNNSEAYDVFLFERKEYIKSMMLKFMEEE